MSQSKYQWLDYAAGAEYLGITERRLRRAVQAGKVEHVRLGLRVQFTTDMLDRYVAACTREAVA